MFLTILFEKIAPNYAEYGAGKPILSSIPIKIAIFE
jgi:hypothetical protein